MVQRPKNEAELQEREAIGVIRASRFIRRYAKAHTKISMGTVCRIHREIFSFAWSDIAGTYRGENLEITDSHHHPPHYTEVPGLMENADEELAEKLEAVHMAEGTIRDEVIDEESAVGAIDHVIKTAAWLHHVITYIHPFRDGNGRTARLAANLILERFGLVGISIKVEQQNKNRYRKALAQIDDHGDYEPLVEMMYEGLIERYEGVPMKFYPAKK
ncbi:hypothetical protein A3E39_03305 [Candidatus Uhrbacteria bacterium RIFCSPHIGHO2_12_FULL_60_25]|uniref:Fido domain-containing protein n=1 Tax=Candidatus Uhrbacteria bacterium RIFCSPHIGHO2_12_FULL_60_25 TaxID=1802399 RepID=A0A1F7UK96_9BACT|nr:MAG: hypothetical protein A3E39_03305 [Candidatus Uhrbacteria bacterium RIFCSPHIGHO2_12_FULL_60_25]